MTDHWRQEVAQRAGVGADYIDRLIELGLINPRDEVTPGDVRKARWVKNLEQAGVPRDGMAAAVREGLLSFAFLDVSVFDRFGGLTDTTFQQVRDETGIPIELLSVIRESFGYPEPSPQEYVREGELPVIRLVEFQLSKGFRPIVIERSLRVHGESFRRMVDTEADAWRSEVVAPILETGMSESEMLEVQAHLGAEMGPLIEAGLLAIYQGQQEHAWTRVHIESIEGALEKADLFSRLHGPPAVSFLDLTGYTRLTEERGDKAAAELAARLRAMVRQSSVDHGGASVKWLGDGVMFFYPEPSHSVLAGVEMVEHAATQSLPPARVGIHAGPVVFQEGDYFGRTVNIAARISEYARPGEVLVTQEVVDAASESPLAFDDVGPVELKGVTGAMHLHRAHRG
jgi:adenylate cyclase